MVRIVSTDNLSANFIIDGDSNKILVNTDGVTIRSKTNGQLEVSTDTAEFISAIRDAETETVIGFRKDNDTGERFITYQSERGPIQEVNLTSLIQDIHVTGGSMRGNSLVLVDNDGEEIVIDLSQFLVEQDVIDLISAAFNETVTDAFGVPLFKAASL